MMASGSEPSTSSSSAAQQRVVDGVRQRGDVVQVEHDVAQLRCGGAEHALRRRRTRRRRAPRQPLRRSRASGRPAAASRIGDVGVGQLLGEFARGGERGERDDDGADPGGGQHADDEVGSRSGRAGRRGCPCRRRGRRARGPATPNGVRPRRNSAGRRRRPAADASPRDAALARITRTTVGRSAAWRPGDGRGSAKCAPHRAQIGLARRCPRDGVDDRDVGGNLVARQPGSQVRRASSSRPRWRVAAQFDHRHGRLAEAVVRPPDHGRAQYGGVALQRGAHVVGHHLEAAADDRLVGAAEDPQEAVGVDAGQVGGADPVDVRGRAGPA